MLYPAIPFLPCITSLIFVLTNRKKGATELEKREVLGKLSQLLTTHFWPLFKQLRCTLYLINLKNPTSDHVCPSVYLNVNESFPPNVCLTSFWIVSLQYCQDYRIIVNFLIQIVFTWILIFSFLFPVLFHILFIIVAGSATVSDPDPKFTTFFTLHTKINNVFC